jgi:hypothetical protein
MRNRLCLQFAAILLLIAPAARAQAPAAQMKTTDVLVMLTIKPGIGREQIMNVMPEEIRATVRLYLDGKIRQWYSRADGKGVIFILDCQDVVEARSIMEGLPLSKEKLANYEFIPMAPLAPLGALLGGAAPRQ